MIEVVGLTKHYRDLAAISDVSFTVGKGEIVGFLGPNGAGKTTTMKILTGFMPATAGQVRVAGFDVFEEPMAVKRRVGYLPETPPVYSEMTVIEYLRFVGKLKGLRGVGLAAEVERVAQRVHLIPVILRLIGNLSKGFQQRVGLAQALLGNPPVLILDEPTVGLDPRQIGEVRGLIGELAGEHTVILSSHILPEIRAICPRVIIISRGRIVADAKLPELVAQHRVGGRDASLEEIFLSLTEM